jgi:group I intron endonuclease
MFYTIYKITNQINGKYYIGKHQTKNLDDGYMGSGKLLKQAIAKYGIENFKKEILHIFDNEADMNAKEKELVVVCESTYNLNEGGRGGFSYINNNVELRKLKNRKAREVANSRGASEKALQRLSELRLNPDWEEKRKKNWSQTIAELYPDRDIFRSFLGRTHSDETKEKMRESHKGKHIGISNSQYGTCWVSNHDITIKIKVEEIESYLQCGYVRGRKRLDIRADKST